MTLDMILMRFTDLSIAGDQAVKAVSEQPEGTHADEIETSMMLHIAPSTVDMSKAAKDFPKGTGPLTPTNPAGRFSPSGIYGDATLATKTKGEKLTEGLVTDILKDIEALRYLPLP